MKASTKIRKKVREPITQLEDLRDDCIAVVINSRMTHKQVHERGGPTTQTIGKWLYRETRFPQLATVRAILNACGHDLKIVSNNVAITRIGTDGIKYLRPTKVARRGQPVKRRQANLVA